MTGRGFAVILKPGVGGLEPVQIAGKSLVNLVQLSEYSDPTIGRWSEYINSGVGKFCIGKGVHVVQILFVNLIRPSLYLNFTGLAKSGGGGGGGDAEMKQKEIKSN